MEPKSGLISKNDTPRNSYNSFWDSLSKTQPVSLEEQTKSRREDWPKTYVGTILDKVTKIQCITNCSDIDLARCDDTVEDYITSPLNTATKRCSGKDRTIGTVTKHRSFANSLLRGDDPSSASNSMYTDDDYEEDDLGTYDDTLTP